MRKNIAWYMREILLREKRNSIWYGDLELIEECALLTNTKKSHPQNTIRSILNGLDRSKIFEKTYICADFNGYRRKYRCFILKAPN